MARVYSWIWQVGRTLCSGAAVQHEKMTLFEMSTVMISVPVDLIFFFCFFFFFCVWMDYGQLTSAGSEFTTFCGLT